MNPRDELAFIIRQNRMPWVTNTEHREMEDHQAAVILAAGYSKPRTITEGVVYVTTLPVQSVIRTKQGYTMEKLTEGWYRAGVIYAYEPNPNWLPATVLYTPGDSK